jgi:MFS family permease
MRAMPSHLSTFAPVLLGIASAQVAQGLLGPLIPLLLLEQFVPTAQIGMVASAHSLGFLIGALYCQRLVTRLGHGRAFVCFAVIAADAILLMALWRSPWGWALLRGLSGVAYAGMCIVAESWLNARADNASRGRVFALYMVASWGGGVAGPLMLSVMPPSAALIAFAGMAFATALLPIALSQPANPPIATGPRMRLMDLLRVSPVGIACGLTAGLANSVFHALSPVYLRNLGHDAAAVALFAMAANLAGLAMQMPAGWASDRLGRRPIALIAMLGSGGAAIAFLLAGPSAPVATLVLLGLVCSGMASPLYGLINDRLDSGDAVAAAGALLLVWSIGATIGPLVGGAVMEAIGPAGLFWYLSVVLAAMALFTLWRMALRPEPPRDQRTAFVPAATPPPGLSGTAQTKT